MSRARLLGLVALLLVAVGLGLAGCRGGDGDSTPPANDTPTPAATPVAGSPAPAAATENTATPASGTRTVATATPTALASACPALPSDLRPGETTRRGLESAGRQRAYLVYVPKGYDASRPLPLMLNFHGLGSSMAEQHAYAGWVPVADREGFIVVSPDGVERSWLLAAGLDDIRFVRDLVAELEEELCIDPGQVYTSGMSNGGFMSTVLACQANDLIAGVIAVTGATPPTASCGPKPVPFVLFHGTEDPVVPYNGGPIVIGGQQVGTFQGVGPILEGWAKQNRCTGGPSETRVADDVVKVEYVGCAAPVVHYRVEGGGHTWPGAVPVPRLGKTTSSISASEEGWKGVR
ncbi:hypothetical protein [Tepidiforma sp.]|uniref:alpha/beta hydrolase family esterase n=1 Tax=Tepidiforma sp. TaxID=2682230 RepID=UPI002ADDE49E|nr:hypothetical protein [Tepidiforma sp.]